MVNYGRTGIFPRKALQRWIAHLRLRGRRHIRACALALGVFGLLALILSYSDKLQSSAILYGGFRSISRKSPLHAMRAVDAREIHTWPLEKKCKWYFGNGKREQWLNEIIDTTHGRMNDAAVASAVMERLRVFESCFMDVDMRLREGFGEKTDIYALNKDLFPFLKETNDWSDLLPEVVDINEGSTYLLGNNDPHTTFKMDIDVPFWENLRRSSSGRGIVLTVADFHLDQLKRLLNVLDELENKMPIELVYKGGDFSSSSIDVLKKYVLERTKQRVRLVDCSRVFDSAHEPKIRRFLNKWLATIFNSFEEILLLDVDVIPFVPTDKFFKLDGYAKTGALFFKDRTLSQYLPTSCIKAVQLQTPSLEENRVWGHHMRYSAPLTKNGDFELENTIEAEVMYNYFIDRYRHQVETGLVVMNRKEKLFSLVTSLMLHLNLRFTECFHGDKELFWLGQLLSGKEYSIHPMPAAIIGEIQRGKWKLIGTEYKICSTQIAHPDTDGTILWVNGGLWNCKHEGAAEQEFYNSHRYFARKFGTKEKLADWYKQPLKITGAFSPELLNAKWQQRKECLHSTYCSSVLVRDEQQLRSLQDAAMSTHNHFASIWCTLPDEAELRGII
ncbi:AaceriAAR183Cp [[Ashbya] aceris (nom. inval.)]|nr:AaceriAAR183Cp [[Ashbya] aceris (nom. inval.)]